MWSLVVVSGEDNMQLAVRPGSIYDQILVRNKTKLSRKQQQKEPEREILQIQPALPCHIAQFTYLLCLPATLTLLARGTAWPWWFIINMGQADPVRVRYWPHPQCRSGHFWETGWIQPPFQAEVIAFLWAYWHDEYEIGWIIIRASPLCTWPT